jgi:hypothetical protein
VPEDDQSRVRKPGSGANSVNWVISDDVGESVTGPRGPAAEILKITI